MLIITGVFSLVCGIGSLASGNFCNYFKLTFKVWIPVTAGMLLKRAKLHLVLQIFPQSKTRQLLIQGLIFIRIFCCIEGY